MHSEFDEDRMVSVRASVLEDGERRIVELEELHLADEQSVRNMERRIGELEADLAKCRWHRSHEEADAEYEVLARENARLRECLKRLVTRLDQVHESSAYRAVWELWMIHNGPYAGPQYAKELEKAKAELKEK